MAVLTWRVFYRRNNRSAPSTRQGGARGSIGQPPEEIRDTPPQKKQRYYLMNVSWLLDTKNDTIGSIGSYNFFVCKGLSNDGVGVSKGFHIHSRELVSTPAILLTKNWGRATVERLSGVANK